MEELLKQTLNRLDGIEFVQKQIQEDLNNVKSVQKEHTEILYSIKNQLNELDAKNAANHIDVLDKIDDLSKVVSKSEDAYNIMQGMKNLFIKG